MKNYKSDFPIFKTHPGLIYLDSATTSHKPESVIRAIADFYRHTYSSTYRGLYTMAEQATAQYEAVRSLCARFIGALPHEILFTKNATESINIVAHSWASVHINEGDEIVVSELEHHANLLPWQHIAHANKATLRWLPFTYQQGIVLNNIKETITSKTKLVALTAYSNVLGGFSGGHQEALMPVIQRAQQVGARVLLDAAQLVPHTPINVHTLGCDFLVFSAHKMLGPQGVGILYVKESMHNQLIPYQRGGGMVSRVEPERAQWRSFPYLLEAGTQPAAQVVGFGAALEYLMHNVDFAALQEHETNLTNRLIEQLAMMPQVKTCMSPSATPNHLVSFSIEGIHPHDIASYLDTQNICVRAGNHCAQLVHTHLNVPATVRASFYLYNTIQDVENCGKALATLLKTTSIKKP